MKIENNRALAAEKKTYEIPSVSMTQFKPCTIICTSPEPPLPILPPITGEGD
jgi:hypothetical protein